MRPPDGGSLVESVALGEVRRRLWATRTEIWRREPQRPVVKRERDVVRRSAPLDFVRLEERGLERSGYDVERDRACLRQHLKQSLGHAVLLPKVAVDAVMERRRLADIQHQDEAATP